MLQKIKSFLGRWIFEIIPVFVGVILALYFSNLKEENDHIKFVEQLKHSVIIEIEGDISDIDSLSHGERAAMDSLLFYASNDTMSVYDVLSRTGVIAFPSLEFSTWSIIQSSGNAFLLEAETLREMVSMDIMINRHHIESINGLGDFILLNMFKKERDIKMTIYMLLGNNMVLEEQIKTDLLHLKSLIEKPN